MPDIRFDMVVNDSLVAKTFDNVQGWVDRAITSIRGFVNNVDDSVNAWKRAMNIINDASKSSDPINALYDSMDELHDEFMKLHDDLEKADKDLDIAEKLGDPQQIEDAKANVEGLEKELNRLNKTIDFVKKGTEEFKKKLEGTAEDTEKANKTIENNTKKLKENGNALEKAFGGAENFRNIMRVLPEPIRAVITAIQGMTTASLSFIATPLGAVLAALAATIALVTTYFKGATDGEDEFVKVTGYAKGVVTALKDDAIDMGRNIYNAFVEATSGATQFLASIEPVKKTLAALHDFLKTDAGEKTQQAIAGQFSWLGGLGGILAGNYLTVKKLDEINDKATKREQLEKEQHQNNVARIKNIEKEAELNQQLADIREKMYGAKPGEIVKLQAQAQDVLNKKYDEQIKLAKEDARIQKELNENSESTYADVEALATKNARIKELERAKKMEGMMFTRRGASAQNAMAKSLQQQQAQMAKNQMALDSLERSQYNSDAKLLQQLENQVAQARIEANMKGEEKYLAQQELNHKMEIDQLEAQRANFLKTKIDAAQKKFSLNPANKGKTFDVEAFMQSDEYKSYEARVDALINQAKEGMNKTYLQKQTKEQEAAMQNYLAQYGTYQEKRLAIAKQYDDKIQEAKNEGERLSLQKQKETALQSLDFQEFEKQMDWEAIFNGLDVASKSHLKLLRDELQRMLEEGIKSGMSPENIKTLTERIAAIDKETQSRKAFSFGGETKQKFNSQRDALNERLNGLLAQRTKASEEALVELNKQINAVINSMKQLDDAEKNWRVKLLEFADSMDVAIDALSGLDSIMGTLGLSDTGIGKGISNALAGTESAKSAMLNFESGNYVGAAADALSSLKSYRDAISSTFGISAGNAAEVNRITEENTKAISYLTERIEVLKDTIDSNNKSNAISAANSAVKAQQEINQRAMETLKAQMGYTSAHHSNNYYASDSEIAKLYAQGVQTAITAGQKMQDSVNGLTDIYKMTPEQIAAIKTYMPALWEYLTTVGKYDKSEYWEAVVNQAGKLEELTTELKESLTGISFDGLYDSFVSSLMDMDKEAADFADDFSEYMMKAMLQTAIGEILEGELQNFYDNWADKMKQGSLTQDDINEMSKSWEDIVNSGINIRDSIAELTGYDEASSSTTTGKAVSSMSQETADELNGRFTAFQISNESINQQMAMAVMQLQEMSALDIARNLTLAGIHEQIAFGNAYLEQIAQNTKRLGNVETYLNNIDNNTKNL